MEMMNLDTLDTTEPQIEVWLAANCAIVSLFSIMQLDLTSMRSVLGRGGHELEKKHLQNRLVNGAAQ
jgi:hypothetical protein